MKKVLLIFGSNGALGQGVTKALLSKDYDKVYLFDFGLEESSTTKVVQTEIKDLSLEENVKKAFDVVKPAKETAYFLFSTIGGYAGGNKVWETNLNELDKMLNMNFKTNFLIAKYFSRLVKDCHSGSIFFTAAYTGLNAEVTKAAYGASKAALIHLVETLAKEGKEINLSVNAIAPHIIDTPSNREWMKNADYDGWMKPEEIGEFVHSIFSSYNFTTGNVFKLTHRFNL